MQISHGQISDNSFGWHINLHNNVTKKACQKLGLSLDKTNKLAYYVKKPDLDEILFFRQKHYFYPNLNKSFLDFSKTRNAKAAYHQHLNKMRQAYYQKNENKFLNEAARALHFLQDVSQPHHIEEGSIFQKAKDIIYPHIIFEMEVNNSLDKIYKNFTPQKIKAKTFEELFDETLKLSQKNAIPKRINRNQWTEISQKAVNLTISSTERFIKLIKKYL